MSRSENYWTGGISVVSDLDGDGLMEFVSGRHIQEYDGTMRCLPYGDTDGFTAVADPQHGWIWRNRSNWTFKCRRVRSKLYDAQRLAQ